MKIQNRFASALPKQLAMLEITQASAPRIKSALSKRGIALASLRPGDRLESEFGTRFTVIQNSAKLGKVELRNETEGRNLVSEYSLFTFGSYLITYQGPKQDPQTLWGWFKGLFA